MPSSLRGILIFTFPLVQTIGSVRIFRAPLFKKNWRDLLIHTFHVIPHFIYLAITWSFWNAMLHSLGEHTMLMECGYEKCAEAKIVDEFTYDYKKKHEKLLECLECNGIMFMCKKKLINRNLILYC